MSYVLAGILLALPPNLGAFNVTCYASPSQFSIADVNICAPDGVTSMFVKTVCTYCDTQDGPCSTPRFNVFSLNRRGCHRITASCFPGQTAETNVAATLDLEYPNFRAFEYDGGCSQ